jgi:hypothetical protein
MPDISVSRKTFSSLNSLSVMVGTNCPAGGDTGHGGRTILRIKNESSTDLRICVDNGPLQDVESIEIVLGGDSECDTFLSALEFAVKTLKTQIAANKIINDEISIK